jgi:hypothetical protein
MGDVMRSDDLAALQILSVFAKYKITVGGVLRRHQFFEVRDGDFQRGIDAAVSKGWIQRHARDRYRYILLAAGREAFNSVLIPNLAPPPVVMAEVAPPAL